jgi:hypothetical protein
MLKHVYEASERETTLGMVKTYLLSIRTRDKLGFKSIIAGNTVT